MAKRTDRGRFDRTRRTGSLGPTVLVAAGLLVGCGAPDADPDVATSDSGIARPAVPTSNPFEYGYTEADYPRVIEVGPDVYAYEQIHMAAGETITTVSLIVVTPAGVLIADGQESPTETQRLIDTVAEITDQPITHLVIASDHGDHTGGNSAFDSDVYVLAHATSAATLAAIAENPNRPSDAPPIVMPSEIFTDERVVELGGREIQLLHLGRAHTGGDLVVYVPDAKVLFMSETYCKDIFPPMRSAHPSEWVTMLERAMAMDVDVYVPGHGVMESPDVLEESLNEFYRATVRVVEGTTELHAAGLSVDEAIEATDFGDIETWSLRDSQLPTAVRRIYMELNGELPE